MQETIPLTSWKALVEKKSKKKILIKMIWNDQEKITLFITPNMKINSFIHDEKEGYLFYDLEGKRIDYPIPSIITEKDLVNGEVNLLGEKKLTISGQPLAKEDIQFLKENQFLS
jgi:oligoribonuclease NrnB/cAMP/cGMP phosphodiesterase (DHH superfamily)